MKVKVLTPVKHDGQSFEVGDVIEGLKEAQLEALLEAGAVEVVKGKSKSKDPKEDEDKVEDELPVSKRSTKQELLDHAEKLGLEVNPTMTKSELWDAISNV